MGRLLFIVFFLSPVFGDHGQHLPVQPRREESVIGCGPAPLSSIPVGADGRYAPVFPGWGHYHFAIATRADSAQYYFDQGLSLYYGYQLSEALASFKEAARRDSGCVMAYWGQALAMGPYYNSTYYYKMPLAVLPVLDRMNGLAASASARERDLVAVMDERYSNDTTDRRRSVLNKAYSEGMKGLMGRYPGDNDIKALYIDGVMIEHAWDLWDIKGEAKPWTPGLVRYCDEILAADPHHPAALHYHIHLLEASLHPEATLPSADRLKDLMPGVPHMVHMASHSYQRTGLYAKGVAINDAANAAQKQFSLLAPQLHLPDNIIHYDAVEAFCAMNGAMYGKALQSAGLCTRIVSGRTGVSRNLYLQYLSMMPVFVMVRMGKWQAILDEPVPDGGWVYASLLSDFARGMAYVRMGRLDSARNYLASLQGKLKDDMLTVRQLPNNAPIQGASVAEGILEGELSFAEKRTSEAMAAFERAIDREDGMSYMEPRDWLLPARHFAGACLLKQKKAAAAEKLYEDDLVLDPGNGWAMLGLAQSLDMQRKKGASEYRAKAREAFADAEEMPTASAY
jgi:tetratricopeptide (TPR) repeat protein